MQSQSTPLPAADVLRNALTQVIDPEVGMNIVDLGLVYDIRIAAERVEVDITMTTPACPMSSMIAEQAREVIMAAIAADAEVVVNLVWDPPWDASMMSDRAREHFGWR
ncbi:MAG: metal-sulfur cluster assembly factor [Gammaproteobacteria bacterium]|nr:metal-sulfur cluster assembly factor [Gammaproteobacteria bacterium]